MSNQITQIKGRVLSKDDSEPLYSATIMVTDSSGKMIGGGVVANVIDASYSIPVNPTQSGAYLTAKYVGYKDLIVPINFTPSQSGFNKMDLLMSSKTSLLDEFTIYADKVVEKDSSSWWSKNKWYALGVGALTLTLVSIILIKKNK